MLAKDIKPRRLELDLLQKELAELAGCNRMTIVKLEKENAKGSDRVLHRINKALAKLEQGDDNATHG